MAGVFCVLASLLVIVIKKQPSSEITGKGVLSGSCDETNIHINSPEGTISKQNEYVFSLIGYQPNISMLQNLGIQTDFSTLVPSFNPETYESNVKNIFLSGVVTGGITNRVYIEDGRFHGLNIAEEIEQHLSYIQSS